MINENEIMYKMYIIIEYLKCHKGYRYKLYNRLCPGMGKPDSNIVEYAEDVLEMIDKLLKTRNFV
mgnify:CR=1 FL=1